MRPLFICLLLCAALILSAPGLHAQESDPTALKIFDAAVNRLKSNSLALRKWQYYQTLTTRQYDGDGKVLGKGTWHSLFRPGDRDSIEYLSESKEGKLDFFKDDPPKTAATPAPSPEADKKDAIGKKASADESLDTDRLESVAQMVGKYHLRDRYFWTRLPDGQAAGEDAFVIAYRPRPGQSAHSREERIFSLLAGKIWISQTDYSVLKADGVLQSPYHLMWIIARLTKLEFTYEAASAPANRLLRGSEARAETIVVLPFQTIRQKHLLEVERYEARTARKH